MCGHVTNIFHRYRGNERNGLKRKSETCASVLFWINLSSLEWSPIILNLNVNHLIHIEVHKRGPTRQTGKESPLYGCRRTIQLLRKLLTTGTVKEFLDQRTYTYKMVAFKKSPYQYHFYDVLYLEMWVKTIDDSWFQLWSLKIKHVTGFLHEYFNTVFSDPK